VSDDINPPGEPNHDEAKAVATERLVLHTGDGLDLEAELRLGTSPRAAVVLAHPHPQQGGSMRSLVTSELFSALPDRGIAALRFNFRGVEASEGEHGGGIAEHADIVAALDALASRVTAVPLVLAGWSFGADVSLSVLDARLAGWFLIAAPLRVLATEAFVASTDPRPKFFVVPEKDQFRQPDAVRAFTDGWINTEITVVAGADHFLVGRTANAVDLLAGFALGSR
jgi:alpha/beta superfamily hydrolase